MDAIERNAHAVREARPVWDGLRRAAARAAAAPSVVVRLVLESSGMRFRAVVATVVGAGCAACSRTLPHPSYVPQPARALVEVNAPAPPGRIEEIPPQPNRAAVWVDGEWSRRRERWAWLPGEWVNPPKEWRLAPWVFERAPDGRMWYAPSTWYDASGTAQAEPPALSLARVEETLVVNPSGIGEATGPVLRRASAPPAGPSGR
jgi:hypothetical protein